MQNKTHIYAAFKRLTSVLKTHTDWKWRGWKNVLHANGNGNKTWMLSHFSRVRLCATPETASHQAPPSLGFSRQEHWSGLPFPSPMHESEKWKGSRSVLAWKWVQFVWELGQSLALPFFGIGRKLDLFTFYALCWVFQICWRSECSILTASSFRIWNRSTWMLSPPLALFTVMLPKAHLT